MNHCIFCHTNLISEPLYENQHCYILPDISPLIPGHLLIIPKQHVLGIARCDKPVLNSVIDAIEMAVFHYTGDITIFEHGAINLLCGGTSISHAHIHILPQLIDISNSIESYTCTSPYKIHLHELRKYSDHAYLYFQNGWNSKGLLYKTNSVPRQFLRKLILENLNLPPLYDWEQAYFTKESKEKVTQTIAMWNSTIGGAKSESFKFNKK